LPPANSPCVKGLLYVDVAAQRLLSAEKGTQKIAVEIKTFGSPLPVNDLQEAIGQFCMYEDALEDIEPDRLLYLAVPRSAFEGIFNETLGQKALQKRITRILVYDIELEEIVKWIPQI
jgi:hypothetical protein